MCKTSPSSVRKFTWAEVEASVPKNATMNSLAAGKPVYVVIHSKVYDLSGDFMAFHPGGGVAISQLGKDASGAFEVFHSEHASEIMSNYYVGDLEDREVKKQDAFQRDLQQLRVSMEQNKIYDTNFLFYAWKVGSTFSLLVLSLLILANFNKSTLGVVVSGAVLAVFWQQSGWLAHDFLHHQVFTDRRFNNAVGYVVGNIWQGFSVRWWKNKHCTHHSTPNVHQEDPDISTMPFLAWSEHALELFSEISNEKLAKFLIYNQNVIYFPLLMLARVSWANQSAITLFPKRAAELMITGEELLVERICLSLHWVWYLGVMAYYLSPLHALLWFVVSQAGCGLLLALVFSLNHNGMPVFTNEESKSIDFYELQIVTGRNVKSNVFTDWFTGGLNYQIEHHIFPLVPRHNLRKLSELIVPLCKKHGVSYHNTEFGVGLAEVLARLRAIAKLAAKKHGH